MKKQWFGILTYSQLFEKFSIVFKKDYEDNKDSTAIYTILFNSLDRTLSDYYPRYILWIVLILLGLLLLLFFDELFVGFITFYAWFSIVTIVLVLFSRTPSLKSLKTLKYNVNHISDSLRDSDFSAEEVLRLIEDIKNKRQLKGEILLQKYFDHVSPSFVEDKDKDKSSTPLGRLMCYQLINQVSKIPISNKETRLLIASLLRIGHTNLSSHNTDLKEIYALTSIDNNERKVKSLSKEDIEYLKDQVGVSRNILKRSLIEAEEIYKKLDTIEQNQV